MKPYIATDLRDMNRRTVYKLVSSVDKISKAEISRQTGISAPTVIKIVNFLLEKDILIEVGDGDSAIGRKPQMLVFNPDAAFSIGAYYEGDYLRLGIVNLAGNVIYLKETQIATDFKTIMMGEIAKYIKDLINDSGIEPKKILGLGIGIPGVIDSQNKIIRLAPLIGIDDPVEFDQVFKVLFDELNIPIFIENDVNAAAVGEYVGRKFETDRDLAYISLGTGLGAGIILDGRLRRGMRGCAGEIGYMVFDKDFCTEKTKAGWLESLINIKAIKNKWKITSLKDVKNMPPDKLSALNDYVASYLALCIANMSAYIDIDLCVIGGAIIESLGFSHGFLDKVQEYVSKLCLHDTKVELQKCSDPTIVGIACMVTEEMLDYLLSDEKNKI